MQFWSGNIPVILNRTRAARSENFKITPMISDQIALHSVQLTLCKSVYCVIVIISVLIVVIMFNTLFYQGWTMVFKTVGGADKKSLQRLRI